MKSEEEKQSDTFPVEESERRFNALIKAALGTSPKPLKDVPRKRGNSKPQRKRAVKPSSA